MMREEEVAGRVVDMVYLAGVIDGADAFRCIKVKTQDVKRDRAAPRLRFEICFKVSFELEDFLIRLRKALGVGEITGPLQRYDRKLKRRVPMLQYRIKTKQELKQAIEVLDEVKFSRKQMEYEIWRAGAMKWIEWGPAKAAENHRNLRQYLEKIIK
jgi:hypothetical protein